MNRGVNKFVSGRLIKSGERINTLYRSGKHSTSFGGLNTVNRFFKKAGPEKINSVLENIDSYTRHRANKPVRKRNPIYVRKKRFRLQGDLAEFIGLEDDNNGFKYILLIIDVFSKKLWLEKLRTKTEGETLNALKSIMKRVLPIEPGATLCYDYGTEANNRVVKLYLEEIGLEMIHSKTEKCSVVERVISSVKRLIMQYITEKETKSFMHDLKDFENIYNNRYHRSIGFTPLEGEKDENRQAIIERYQRRWSKLEDGKRKLPRFKAGQTVRISNKVDFNHRSYDESHKMHAYKISKVLTHLPVTMYELTEYNGDEMNGVWYERELTEWTGSVFKLNEVLQERKRAGKKEYFVSWMGYSNNYNSWIPEDQLTTL
jgi:hypothetical protein